MVHECVSYRNSNLQLSYTDLLLNYQLSFFNYLSKKDGERKDERGNFVFLIMKDYDIFIFVWIFILKRW